MEFMKRLMIYQEAVDQKNSLPKDVRGLSLLPV